MPKRRSTPQDDPERLAENLNGFDSTIKDRDTFDVAYTRYLSGTELLDNRKFREETFRQLRKHNSRVTTERTFTKAEGKSLRQDQQTTSKTVVKSRREYIKQGASNVDLQGYDTKRKFDKIGIINNRSIFARESKNKTINGKQITVLRDHKGRFVRRRK